MCQTDLEVEDSRVSCDGGILVWQIVCAFDVPRPSWHNARVSRSGTEHEDVSSQQAIPEGDECSLPSVVSLPVEIDCYRIEEDDRDVDQEQG
jgi:hypothetical protein